MTKSVTKEFPLFLLPFLEKKRSLSPCHRKITSASSVTFHSQLEECGDNGDTVTKRENFNEIDEYSCHRSNQAR